jgi:hypothetical protein
MLIVKYGTGSRGLRKNSDVALCLLNGLNIVNFLITSYGGENDRAYIEVFENEFGVLISKDQPCFIVDSSNTLVYFGDADTFIKNMDRYVQEKQIRKLETKAARSVEKNTATITSENKDTVSLDTLMSDVKEVQIDSIIQEIEKDSVIRKKNDDDTLQNGQLNIDTIIKKKDNPIKE